MSLVEKVKKAISEIDPHSCSNYDALECIQSGRRRLVLGSGTYCLVSEDVYCPLKFSEADPSCALSYCRISEYKEELESRR